MFIKSAIIFAIGAVVGSATTYAVLKKKYELITQQEIDSVKEAFEKRKASAEQKAAEYAKKKPDIKNLYPGLKLVSDKRGDNMKPYVITPAEFGENEEYDTVTLKYYADKILTDENDEPVVDIDNTVGFDSLSTFGTYEEDAVYVRNNRLRCDFEILADEQRYVEDIIKNLPPT